MKRFRYVKQTVLSDAMKIAQVKERLEKVIEELQVTVDCLDQVLTKTEGQNNDLGR